MPERTLKRYDVSGKNRGGRTPYPEGTILKLSDEQAAAMGLTSSDVSKVTTTADDVTKADRYEEALASAETMRAADRAASSGTVDDAGTTDAKTRKRGAAGS